MADHSINGTYIRLANSAEIRLARAAIPLDGEGILSLGRPLKDDSRGHAVAFKRDRRSMFRP